MGIRSLLRRFQRSPAAYPDVASLFDARTASRHLEAIVDIQPCRELVSHAPGATPERITRYLAQRQGYWLRDVWVWLEAGVIRTADGKLIAETLPSKFRMLRMLRAGAYAREPDSSQTMTIDVPFASLGGGHWYGHYYHWLIDEMPRTLGLDFADDVQQLYVPIGYPKALFELVRFVTPEQVEVVRPPTDGSWVFARRYFFLPPLTADYCGYLPAAYIHKLREALMQYERAVTRQRRVYISRAGATKRRILNEEVLVELLQKEGFEVVQAERLAFEEQVRLFSGASQIVGAPGAGLTNMLFSPQCTVIELFPGAPFTHYRWLSESLGHVYRNLPGASNRGKHDDFAVDTEALRGLLLMKIA